MKSFFENNINMKERFVNTPLLNIDSILYVVYLVLNAEIKTAH